MKRRHKNAETNFQLKKHLDLPVRNPQPTGVKKHAGNKRKIEQLVVKGLLLGLFVGLAIYATIYVWSWSISSSKTESEKFTELYFDNSLQLPSNVVPKRLYPFQFTIHNLEDKDMEYSYLVYLEVGQDRFILDEGDVFVKLNGYRTISEKFVTKSILPRSEIVVDLVNKNQQIDFWIEGSS